MREKFKAVTIDQVCEVLSTLEPEKYILFVQTTNPNRYTDYLYTNYLKEKLGLEKSSKVIDALFFRATFNSLEEARNFVAEYLSDDRHWQTLALVIYHEGQLLWEGMKKQC